MNYEPNLSLKPRGYELLQKISKMFITLNSYFTYLQLISTEEI